MAKSNLWVEDADGLVRVRADQIVAIRAVRLAPTEPDQPTWRLEVVTAMPLGAGGSNVVPLCHGRSEDFPNYAGGTLAGLIAQYIDDPTGGLIDTANEGTAFELNDAMFNFASFNPKDLHWPRQNPNPGAASR